MTEDGLYTLDGKKADYENTPDKRDRIIIKKGSIDINRSDRKKSRKIIIDDNGVKIEKSTEETTPQPKTEIKATPQPDSIVVPRVKLAKELELPKKEISWQSGLNLDAGYNHISMSSQ